jgi:hypothetical protein
MTEPQGEERRRFVQDLERQAEFANRLLEEIDRQRQEAERQGLNFTAPTEEQLKKVGRGSKPDDRLSGVER